MRFCTFLATSCSQPDGGLRCLRVTDDAPDCLISAAFDAHVECLFMLFWRRRALSQMVVYAVCASAPLWACWRTSRAQPDGDLAICSLPLKFSIFQVFCVAENNHSKTQCFSYDRVDLLCACKMWLHDSLTCLESMLGSFTMVEDQTAKFRSLRAA
jgi:hypothetical protein